MQGSLAEFPSLGGSGHADLESDAAASKSDQEPVEERNSSPLSSPQQSAKDPPAPLNLEDDNAFPMLGSSTGANPNAPSGSNYASAAGSDTVSHRASPAPAWGVGSTRATEMSCSDSLILPANRIYLPTKSSSINPSRANQKSQPTTLGDVISQVLRSHPGIKIDASTANSVTTFLIRGKTPALVDKAKSDLASRIERRIDMQVLVPASTRPFIVGQKGATLKALQDRTGVHIQVPPRQQQQQDSDSVDSSGMQNGTTIDAPHDPEIAIVITGPASAAEKARTQVLEIVRQKTSKLSRKLTKDDVPFEYWPLLRMRVDAILIAAKQTTSAVSSSEGEQASVLDINIPTGHKAYLMNATNEPAIILSGDRDLVGTAEEVLKDQLDVLMRTTRTAQLDLPKRQHRFLLGSNAEDILQKFGCSVETPSADDPSQAVTLRGDPNQIGAAFSEVMAKAQSAHVDILDLSSIHHTPNSGSASKNYAKDMIRYLARTQKLKQIAEQHGVEVVPPLSSRSSNEQSCIIEIVGKEPAAVEAARTGLLSIVKRLPPKCLSRVHVDPLLHRHLIGKNGQRIRSFQEKNSVNLVFPTEAEAATDDPEQAFILLIYHPEYSSAASVSTRESSLAGSPRSSAASPILNDSKHKSLSVAKADDEEIKSTVEQVKSQLEKMANEAADLKVSSFKIPTNLHRYFLGPNRSTLNAIIGELNPVVVRIGGNARSVENSSSGADAELVTIRGPSKDVDRIEAEIKRLAQEGRVNESVVEFNVDSRFISHLVGKSGSGITKLKEVLDVRVDMGSPAPSATEQDSKSSGHTGAKKPKSKISETSTVSLVTIRGRKENVEEAKRRMEAQVERLADETTLSIPIPAGIDRGSLIGKQGTYVQRLESKYNVRINFPSASVKGDLSDKQSDVDGSSTAEEDVIRIRGPKKGAEGARREFNELIAYEKEHGNELQISVPETAMARLLGRQGNQIQEISAETGVSIAINKDDSDQTTRRVILKGTKSGIKKAEEMIGNIVNIAANERTVRLQVDPAYHMNLIGRNGQNISALIVRCGGPEDFRAQSGLVRFPPRSTSSESTNEATENDIVTLRGPSDLVEKLSKALEEEVAILKDRVVWGVVIPKSLHAAIIGRGGSGINDVQQEFNVKAIFPSRREYSNVGNVVNVSEVEGADAGEIVKLVGSKASCEKVMQIFQERVGSRKEARNSISETVQVPRSLHHRILDGLRFVRSIPQDVNLSHGDAKLPPKRGIDDQREVESQRQKSAENARIDDVQGGTSFSWEVKKLEDSDKSQADIPWIFSGASQESVEKATNALAEAISKARTRNHQGILQVPRSLMPLIVGRGGLGLDKIRYEYDCDVEVMGKTNSDTLSICGTAKDIEDARQYITELSQNDRS